MKIINEIAIVILIVAIVIGDALNALSMSRLITYIVLLILNGLALMYGED